MDGRSGLRFTLESWYLAITNFDALHWPDLSIRFAGLAATATEPGCMLLHPPWIV